MPRPLQLDPDRLFPADESVRAIARALYGTIADLPIVSPHGHTEARWFADNQPWTDATSLLLAPDHYLFRMLYSQGIDLDALAIPRRDGAPTTDPRVAWRLFADNYFLFRGTPSRLWLDHVFSEVFGIDVALERETADHYYDAIGEALATDAFRPRNHRDVALLLGREFGSDGKDRRRAAADAAFEAFPKLQIIASTARHVVDSDHHRLSARVDARDGHAQTEELELSGIVDRIGAGDAFAAGVLHALRLGEGIEQAATDGLALTCLKHSLPGDASLFGRADLDSFIAGGVDVRR